jgi:hypothetical protein
VTLIAKVNGAVSRDSEIVSGMRGEHNSDRASGLGRCLLGFLKSEYVILYLSDTCNIEIGDQGKTREEENICLLIRVPLLVCPLRYTRWPESLVDLLVRSTHLLAVGSLQHRPSAPGTKVKSVSLIALQHAVSESVMSRNRQEKKGALQMMISE